MDVHFYEAFEEEIVVLRQYFPAHVRAHFTSNTIQESGDTEPPGRTHQHSDAIDHPAVMDRQGEGGRFANNRLRSSGWLPNPVRLSAALL